MSEEMLGSDSIIDRQSAELSVVEFHDILQLRCDVFVVEQNCAYAELDGRDLEHETRHVWIPATDGIAAYARVLHDGPTTWRIGRVVTAPAHRGKGHAKRLIEHLTAPLATEGMEGIEFVLDAQSYLIDWYHNLGFAVSGAEFIEDGIPHVPMRAQGVN